MCVCERFLFNSITQFLSVNLVVLLHPKFGQAMLLGVKAAPASLRISDQALQVCSRPFL